MKITVGLLRKLKACDSQIETFKKVFPKGAQVNKKNYLKAIAKNLSVDWLKGRNTDFDKACSKIFRQRTNLKSPTSINSKSKYIISPNSEYFPSQAISSEGTIREFILNLTSHGNWHSMRSDNYYNSYHLKDLIKIKKGMDLNSIYFKKENKK